MSIPVEVLAQISICQNLKPSILHQVSEAASLRQCQPKEILYEQSEALTNLYVLVSGYAKIYRQSGDRIQILALLHAGDCFGTEALSGDILSSYSVATITDATIITIPTETMQSLMEQLPQFRIVLLQLVTDRLREFALLVHNLAFRDVTARIATILVRRAEQDGVQSEDGIVFPRLMTQSELATMVGTARELVQRTFKKFEQAELIRVSRPLYVKHE